MLVCQPELWKQMFVVRTGLDGLALAPGGVARERSERELGESGLPPGVV